MVCPAEASWQSDVNRVAMSVNKLASESHCLDETEGHSRALPVSPVSTLNFLWVTHGSLMGQLLAKSRGAGPAPSRSSINRTTRCDTTYHLQQPHVLSINMNHHNQQNLPFISSTPLPAPHLSNRTLFRSPQARQDLQRDLQTKWYYKKVSSIHNGALVRQEYRVTVRTNFPMSFRRSLIAFGV